MSRRTSTRSGCDEPVALGSCGAGGLPGPVHGGLLLRGTPVRARSPAGGRRSHDRDPDPAHRVVPAPAVHRPRARLRRADGCGRDRLRPDPGARLVTWRSAASVVLVCLGVGLGVIATLGVVVMRDWQDRVHYAGLSTFAVVLVGVAVLVRESFSTI